MKKVRFIALLLTLLMAFGTTASAQSGQKTYANTGKLKPMYEKADDRSEQVGEVQKGQRFTLLSLDARWAQVSYLDPMGQERTGFIKANNLKEQGEDLGYAWLVSVDNGKIPLYKSAKKSSTVLIRVYPGVLAELLEKKGDKTTKVRVGSLVGFVDSANLSAHAPGQNNQGLQVEAAVQNTDNYSLTLREGPNYKSEKFRGYANGTKVIILGVTEEFAQVMTPEGRTGFMMAQALSPAPTYADLDPADKTERPRGYTSIIDNPEGEGAHLRRRGSSASESMGLYKNGTEVVVTGGTAWWKKVWVDGHTGFMMAKLIRGFVPSEGESESSEPQFDWNEDTFNNPPGWDDAVNPKEDSPKGDGVTAPQGE